MTVLAFLFFWGIGRVPLAQAIALTFIGPLIALLLAAFFLHEKIGPRSIAGSIAAFAGVLVIMFGQAQAKVGPEVLLGSAAILCSAACYAVNIVMMRHQARIAEPLEINFFQSLTVLGVWLFVMPIAGLPPAARAMGLDRGRLAPLDDRHLAVRLGLCAGTRQLSRCHRI